jgi:hypothetical protein
LGINRAAEVGTCNAFQSDCEVCESGKLIKESKTLNMPGLTAEDSLSKSNEHYELIADKAQFLKRQGNYPTAEDCFRWMLYTSATGFGAAV